MAETNNTKLTPLKRFLLLLKPDKQDLIYIYVFAVLNGVVNLSLPLGVQAIIGLIIVGSVSTSWTVLVGIVLVGIALTGVLQILQLSVLESMQQRMFARAAFDMAYRIPRFKQEVIRKYDPTELINRFFDVITVQKGLPKILLDFSSSVLNILFGLILLSFYHPFFVFFGIVMLIILLGIFYLTIPRGMKTSLKESSHKYRAVYWLEELARSMTTFKMAGKTDLPLRKIDEITQDYLQARKKHFRVLIWHYIHTISFKTIITGGLLILGGLLVMQREINIGQFVAGEIIIILIINSVEKVILSLETMYDLFTGLEKLGQVMDIELEQGNQDKAFVLNPCSCVEIETINLKLLLPPQSTAILNGINLKIEKQSTVCISGASGTGKTALLHVLGSIYTDFEGVLAFDGMPLGSIDIESLRYSIGDNFNQETLFTATLEENITLGREGIENEYLHEIIKISGLAEFVMQLPSGLKTIMDPTNRNLPQSIERRVFLARSFVHKPSLLLLDELSDLGELPDYANLINYVTSADRNWTLVLVSNDPEVAKQCDKVVFLEAGRVAHEGHYNELKAIPAVRKIYEL